MLKSLNGSVIFLFITIISFSPPKVNAAEGRWISIGDLHNFYQAHGCEPEQDFGDEQQFGLRWPALYPHQDIQAARGMWIGVANFDDPVAGTVYPYKVVHCGPRPRPSIELNEFMPVEFQTFGRFPHPEVYVNGELSSQLDFMDVVDEYSELLPYDRMIYNVVNTSVGITMERKIKAFTNPGYENFFIYEYTFTNTGICNADGSVIHSNTLDSVYFHWQYRNAICGEGNTQGSGIDWNGYPGWGMPNNSRWGKNTMNDVLGEDPANPNIIPLFPNTSLAVDEFDYSGNILRCFYSWHGKHSEIPYDNIGSPNYQGLEPDGRLGASQFAGVVTLHADMSATNNIDDPYQPKTTVYIQSDDQATANNDQYNATRMQDEYLRLIAAGHPNNSHAEEVGTGYADVFADGSYSQGMGYGPYTMAPGASIRIVLAEGVDGLSRANNTLIGDTWFRNVNGDSLTMLLPDGSTTLDPDEYKNTWVYTGKDSLIRTFKQAKQLFDDDYALPQPPPPPAIFEVISSNDRILLFWDNNAETSPGFAGYKLYRAEWHFETDYQEIFACGQGTANLTLVNSYVDSILEDSTYYFYYITAFDDGSANNGIPLESSKFWTRTNWPAYLIDHPVVPADLYVDPAGDDSNSGLSADDPLQTITVAIAMIVPSSIEPKTIYLAAGIYSPSLTGETFPLVWKSSILSGISAESTILDGEGTAGLFTIGNASSVSINNLTLQNGNSSSSGGAVYCFNSSVSIDSVIIQRNNADVSGGGIYLGENGVLNMSDVTIKNNSAGKGGGIYSAGAEINFDEINLCNIFLNNSGSIGYEIYQTGETVIAIVVDTFTVLAPHDYYTYPDNLFTFNILNSVVGQVDADLFIAVDGDDSWSGLSVSEPLKTITRAMEIIYTDENSPHRINIASGIYSDSTTGERFPIYGMSNLTITGTNRDSTILDGEGGTSLFYLINDSNTTIENMSIINGSASSGGGIYCRASSPLLSDLIISNNTANSGGGIYYIDNSHIQIVDALIQENTAVHSGGGIQGSGTFYFNPSSITLSNSTITANHSDYMGGGIATSFDITMVFDPVNRCNIFLNTAHDLGQDIYSLVPIAITDVVLDTFTVLYLLEEYAYPLDKFVFDIQNSKIEQVFDDLYVSPTGDSTNSGLSVSEPLQTITHALNLIYADETSPQTIHLDNGIYSSVTTGELYPLVMRNHISIIGMSMLESILDADSGSSVVVCENVGNFSISNLTIRNGSAENGGGINCANSSPVISDLLISTNISNQDGGGIYITGSAAPRISDVKISGNYAYRGGGIYITGDAAPRISDVHISGNYAYRGGGIACIESNPVIDRVVISSDSARYGAGIYLFNASPLLRHITVTDNTSSSRGAIFTGGSSYPVIINSILWNDLISSEVDPLNSAAALLYTDIQDGWVGEGNINIDPLFVNAAEGDYSLTEASPCVDRGISFYVIDSDTIIDLPDSAYNSTAPDLGAIESEFVAAIGDQAVLPTEFALHQNYPNPFNPLTTIRYQIPYTSDVRIVIYDILGRQVITLVDEQQQAGFKAVIWDSSNKAGQNVSAGMYFYRLEAENYIRTCKMILLK